MNKNTFLKGFTLIEVMISISIASIVLFITVKIGATLITNYLGSVKENIERNNIDNALLNIDNLVNCSLIEEIQCDFDKNIINVKYTTDIKKNYYKIKTIELHKANLVVSTINYDSDGKTKGENTLLKNVKEFNVIKKENLIYFEIVMASEERYIRCI